MQSDYDQALAQAREPEIAVRAYAPSVLDIKAIQIEAWSERIAARTELAAFVRRLVTSTALGLTNIDFPAHENAQRHGWDGQVTVELATPWVPLGDSGWELGVSRDPLQKAEGDYTARTAEVPPAVRAKTTFIFVTPHNWPGKSNWVAAKRAQKAWKNVRAYDASDLEQWVETSIPAQAWLAERMPLGGRHILDLSGAWRRWAEVTDPVFSKALFKKSAELGARKLNDWLSQSSDAPFTVVAQSADEALAALACAFEAEPLASSHVGERVVVVRTAEAMNKVVAASSSFIIVLASADAQGEAAATHRQHPTIVVTHRNAVEGEPDLTVDLVDDGTFREGLAAMGFAHEDCDRYIQDSGRSLTVLRRRLATLPALRSPPWADDTAVGQRLLPLMFVGAWDTTSEADCAVLAELAATTHDATDRTVAELVGESDCPVWSIGHMRGVVSKIDIFYAAQRLVTAADLRCFFDLAEAVLSEQDPALDLPHDKRWLSAIYGKTRKHSDALRRGICETLVLLSVHGDNLFKVRLGFDVKAAVDSLIRRLLTPLDGAIWQSHRRDLPHYAEAAPEVFLSVLEDDLASQEPKVYALMAPADCSMFSSPSRSGLLWALETLAWNPHWLFRVVTILGKLAGLEVRDNWVNKPENSLSSIFRRWMPQTAASIDERIAALDLLVRKSPKVGRRICLSQFDIHSTIGHFSARPRWRADGAGAGEVVPEHEAWQMGRRALDLAIAWPHHDQATLADLVERLDGIPDDRDRVWTAIRGWLATGPSDAAKAFLRERIRRSAIIGCHRRKAELRSVTSEAQQIYEDLEPQDLVWRHHWLFAQQWIEESPEEREDEELDFQKRDERMSHRRDEALTEIRRTGGFQAVQRLCAGSEAPWVIGVHLARILAPDEVEDFVRMSVEGIADMKMDRCVSGLLLSLSPESRGAIIDRALTPAPSADRFSAAGVERLLHCAPFTSETWDRVDGLPPSRREDYWERIAPSPMFGDDSAAANRVVDELLRVHRPRAAFSSVRIALAELTSDRLLRLLHDAGVSDTEPAGHYMLAGHVISQAFENLSERDDVDGDDLARLEFIYINALSHTKHGIRNLERQLAASPSLFSQALVYAFKRNDDGEDPPELRPKNPEVSRGLASSAYELLCRAKRLPGSNDKGELDARKLQDWIVEAQALARRYGREGVGEQFIGQLLAHSPKGKDGVWPAEAVRDVLEVVGTGKIANGMVVGRLNARGAVWRGNGGEQERRLSEEYRTWSNQVAPRHPFAARMLIEIASSYDREAQRHDSRSMIGKRLPC